ncbi:hypothetical protein PR048_001029, partial [Dryococelus australis]
MKRTSQKTKKKKEFLKKDAKVKSVIVQCLLDMQDYWHNKQRTGKPIGTERKPFKRIETPGGPRAHQANILFTAFSCEVMSKDNIFILNLGATNHLVVIKTTNGGEMIAISAEKFMGDYGSGTICFEALIVPGLKNNLTVVFSEEKVTKGKMFLLSVKKDKSDKGKNVSVECEKGHFNLFLLKLNPLTENVHSALKLNRSPTSTLQNRTPASVWFDENDLSKLRVFGSQAYMLKLPRESKLEPCAKSMIMVRYSGGGYHPWDALKDKIPQTKKRTKEANQIEPSRSLLIYKNMNLYMAYCLCAGEPQDYDDAIKLGNGWEEAIESEIKALELHQTWTPTVLHPGEQAIETKWIFKTKKARLLTKGFQEEPANHVYTSVARLPTIRLLNEPGKVLKLKCLYDLCTAPKKLNERFHNFMETHGMTRSASDFCLYSGENVWLIIWVDDMLVTEEKTQVKNLIRLLKSEFKAKDLGILSDLIEKVSRCILLHGQNTFSWGSRKQGTVAVSTEKAEYIAFTTAACDLVYLWGVLQDFQSATSTTVLLTDNLSAIDMAESFEN